MHEQELSESSRREIGGVRLIRAIRAQGLLFASTTVALEVTNLIGTIPEITRIFDPSTPTVLKLVHATVLLTLESAELAAAAYITWCGTSMVRDPEHPFKVFRKTPGLRRFVNWLDDLTSEQNLYSRDPNP